MERYRKTNKRTITVVLNKSFYILDTYIAYVVYNRRALIPWTTHVVRSVLLIVGTYSGRYDRAFIYTCTDMKCVSIYYLTTYKRFMKLNQLFAAARTTGRVFCSDVFVPILQFAIRVTNLSYYVVLLQIWCTELMPPFRLDTILILRNDVRPSLLTWVRFYVSTYLHSSELNSHALSY